MSEGAKLFLGPGVELRVLLSNFSMARVPYGAWYRTGRGHGRTVLRMGTPEEIKVEQVKKRLGLEHRIYTPPNFWSTMCTVPSLKELYAPTGGGSYATAIPGTAVGTPAPSTQPPKV